VHAAIIDRMRIYLEAVFHCDLGSAYKAAKLARENQLPFTPNQILVNKTAAFIGLLQIPT